MQLFDVIVLALIAIAIAFKLFSILGDENEKDIDLKNKTASSNKEKTKTDKVVNLYGKRKSLVKNIEESFKNGTLEAHDEVELTKDQEIIKPIIEKFPFFSLSKFYNGSKSAYEYIMQEFAKGNKDALKALMSDEIFKIFEANMKLREKNETHEIVFVSNPTIEIIEAELLQGKKARIKLKIDSEQLHLIKDKDGNELENSSKVVSKIEDIWTFEKDMKDPSPDWKLVAIN